MRESEKSGSSPAWASALITVIATAIGASFALFVGVTFVSRGFWAGLFVLLLTIAGAIVGRFYVASERPWWGGE